MIPADKAAQAHEAIRDLLDVPMVTRWVVVVEAIGEDGEQRLYDITSPGLPYWDFTGMLTSAVQGREAQPMWSYDGDEDDE